MRPVKKCTHANYIIENVSKFRQKIMNKETRFLLEIHKTFFTGKGYIVCLVIFISVFFVIQISGKQYSSLEKEHDRLYEEYGGKEYGQIISIVQEKEKNEKTREILKEVYKALTEKGYNPINQIVGYILSGDPTYITSHNGARNLIRQVERDELLEEMVKNYIGLDK